MATQLLILRPKEQTEARVAWIRGEMFELIVTTPVDTLLVQASAPQLQDLAHAINEAIRAKFRPE